MEKKMPIIPHQYMSRSRFLGPLFVIAIMISILFPTTICGQEATQSPVHPRVLVNTAGLQRINEAMETDIQLYRTVRTVLGRAAEALYSTWESKEPKDNYGGVADSAIWQVETMGIAYLLTGDMRYANRLKEIALSVAKFERWVAPSFDRYDPPWISTLESSTFTAAVGLVYDWCYDLFTEEERSLIREAIIQKGVIPAFLDWSNADTKNPHGTHQTPQGNWYAVTISAAAIGALAVEPEAPEVRQYIESFKTAMKAWIEFDGGVLEEYDTSKYLWYPPGAWVSQNFDPDGGYFESLGYANYALYNAVRFFVALGRAEGDWSLLNHSRLDQVPEFFAWTAVVDRSRTAAKGLAFGDTPGGSGDANALAGINLLRNDPVANWFLTFMKSPLGPYSVIYNPYLDGREPAQISLTVPDVLQRPAKLFRGIGWAVLRSGWGPRDTVVGLISGHNAGHAHRDAGSFEVYYQGEPLIVDSGVTAYSSSLYQAYYRASRAHNVVLIDGFEQREYTLPNRGQKEPSVSFSVGVDQFAVAKADFTEAYARRVEQAYRYVLLLGPDLVLIMDDLIPLERARKFEWLFHPQGETNVQDNHVVIKGKSVSATIIPLFSQEIDVKMKAGCLPNDEFAEYYAFGPIVNDMRQTGLFAITLNNIDGADAKVAELDMGEGVGYRIQHRDRQLLVFTGTEGINGQGVKSDATVVALEIAAGEVIRIALVDGSSLYVDGGIEFSSTERSSFVAEQDDSGWQTIVTDFDSAFIVPSSEVSVLYQEPYVR
ncbi:MAG: heparinase II/III family protein [Limnochordia bacterium]|nr:heparinase II/III family protein [Limnochordia bacterium]